MACITYEEPSKLSRKAVLSSSLRERNRDFVTEKSASKSRSPNGYREEQRLGSFVLGQRIRNFVSISNRNFREMFANSAEELYFSVTFVYISFALLSAFKIKLAYVFSVCGGEIGRIIKSAV